MSFLLYIKIERFSVNLCVVNGVEKNLHYTQLYYCNQTLAATLSYAFKNTEAITHIYIYTFTQRQLSLHIR